MFVTHPGAELRSGLQFGDGSKQWAIVERELATPWLHVCLKQTEEGFDFQRVFLVSCVDHFLQLMHDLPDNAAVTSVMSVMPKNDGAGQWSMVPVQAITTHPDRTRQTVTVALTDGASYEEGVRSLDHNSTIPMLYVAG